MTRKRTKWWKLREMMMQIRFRERAYEGRIMESEGGYEVVANKIRDTAKELLGAVSGRRWREDRETWWWDEEIQQVVKEKKDAKKQ